MKGGSSAYETLAPVYDTRWSRYLSRSLELARAHLFANPGETLVDVGCGTGQLLDMVIRKEPQIHAYGIDPSAAMLDVARKRLSNQCCLIEGEAGALPFATASVDWLVSTSAFHHVGDPGRALDEFHRVLRPGGRLVLVDWARDFVTMRLLEVWLQRREPGPIRVHSSKELRRMLATHGFEDVRVQARRLTWMWGMLVATAKRPA